MQGGRIDNRRVTPIFKTNTSRSYYKGGQKTSSLFRIRSKLYSSRYYKQLQSKSDIRNTLAESSESIGTRGGLHSVCQKERERILTKAPRIRVSTIHKAKGGEADNVALLLDSTKACTEQWDQDPEYRVFM